jgi:hypothetical protein
MSNRSSGDYYFDSFLEYRRRERQQTEGVESTISEEGDIIQAQKGNNNHLSITDLIDYQCDIGETLWQQRQNRINRR